MPNQTFLDQMPFCAKFCQKKIGNLHISEKYSNFAADLTRTIVEHLKQIVIRQLGRTLESPADYEYLSEQIQKKTGEYLSPTTLKRVFGHIPYTGQLRPTTLSILARYAGFNGWQDYLDKQHVESGFVSTKRICSDELSVGQKVLIAWNPDRECVVEYLGAKRFMVVHSQNSKLQIGDQFSAYQFALEQPLTANDVVSVREPNQQNTYIAGSQTGLTKIEILNV